MNLRQQQCDAPACARDGLSLIEMIVSLGVGSIVLAIVGMLTVGALRSFVVMGNYSSLDVRNRLAVDKITRDVRQAESVAISPPGSTPKWIEFETRFGDSPKVRYTWYASDFYTNTLICDKGAQTEVYLTGCEQFDFALYQRAPISGVANSFDTATNSALCKMVDLKWKCSRTLLGKKFNTESVQAVRVVLRNKL